MRDEIAFRDHAVHLDVDGSDRGEDVLDGLEPVTGLRIVLHAVFDDQLVEGLDVAGPEGLEEARDPCLFRSVFAIASSY